MITLSPMGTSNPDGSNIGGQAAPAAERGLYVYGVIRGKPEIPDGRLGPIGLDQQEVRLVAEGDLCAVVHDCTATPYQSADRQVLEDWILAHQRVVIEAEQRFGTILPMTFNMIVHGPDDTVAENLRAWLAENRARFVDLFTRLDGKAEFGVQILCDRDAVARTLVETDPELQALRSQIEGQPKGLKYMLSQKLAKATRAAIEAWAQRTAGEFYEQIRRSVQDLRVIKASKGKQQKQTLLTLSCLTPRGDATLGEALDEVAKVPGITVRFTGPWPVYSFVSPG
jgi:hypothetical protein